MMPFTVLSYVGRNAIVFLCTHWMIRDFIIFLKIDSGIYQCIAMVLSMSVICPLLCLFFNMPKFRFIIGR